MSAESSPLRMNTNNNCITDVEITPFQNKLKVPVIGQGLLFILLYAFVS
jgi:hypothetical protein